MGLESLADQAKNIDLNEASLNSLTENLKRLFDCEAATLFAYDSARRQLHSRNFRSQGVMEIRLDISLNNLAGYVAATGKPLKIKNVHSKNELSRYHPNLSYDSGWDERLNFTTRSIMVLPLPHKNKLVGVMEIINKKEAEAFSENDFMKAQAIAPMMGLALAKLAEKESLNGRALKKQIDREEQLHRISHTVHSAQTIEEIQVALPPVLHDLFDCEAANVFSADTEREELVTKLSKDRDLQEVRVPISHQNLPGFVGAEQRLLNIVNVNHREELKKHHPELEFDPVWNDYNETRTRSLLLLPLVHKHKLMGVLQLVNKRSEEGFSGLDENNAFLVAETLALGFLNQEKFSSPPTTKFSYLIDNGLLTEEELTQTMNKARKSRVDIENLLIHELYLRSLDVGQSLQRYYQVPYVGYDESIELPQPEALGLEIETLRKQNWVPLKYDNSGIVVLINNPQDRERIEKIRHLFRNQDIEFRLGLKSDIQKYIDSLFTQDEPEAEEELPEPVEAEAPAPASPPGSPPETEAPLETGPEDKPEEIPLSLEEEMPESELLPVEDQEYESIVQEDSPAPAPPPAQESLPADEVWHEILSVSWKHGVTDIHIEPEGENKSVRVRLRKDGACRVYEKLPGMFRTDLIRHIKELARLEVSQTHLPQNGKILWDREPAKLELDVIVHPTLGDMEDVMVRVVPVGKPRPTLVPLEELNFSEPNLDRILSRICMPQGLILVVGPPGSGKTTTLHALLAQINTPEKKILTAEDPVEIVQSGLRQMPLHPESGLDTFRALDTFRMGTPDVILTTDLADAKTFDLALEVARHQLVLSSVEAESTLDALARTRALGIQEKALGEGLQLIIAQRRVPTLCPHCKEDYHPTRQEFEALAKFYGEDHFPELGVEFSDNLCLKKPAGCKKCIYTGYAETTTLQEVLERSPDLNQKLSEGASIEEIRNQAFQDGMITLNQDGVYKIFKGDIDLKQLQAAISEGETASGG